MANITLFAQVIQHLPKNIFKKIFAEHNSDKHSKGFDSYSHLISMVFCQFANCVSLRDISNGLKSATGNLNHLGIRRAPSKSTLSYQNEHRDSSIFRECYFRLFEIYRTAGEFQAVQVQVQDTRETAGFDNDFIMHEPLRLGALHPHQRCA